MDNKKYHRLGKPGGTGCRVAILPVEIKDLDGQTVPAELLDAGSGNTGHETSEVELLRTVAKGLGVIWGHDEFGWWAVVKGREFPSWAVWRQDDSGTQSIIAYNLPKEQAEALVKQLEGTGHKQTYWCNDEKIG